MRSLASAVAAVATCAPLNPAYRKSEFEFYLNDLKPKALIIHGGEDSPAREVARAHGPTEEIMREAGLSRIRIFASGESDCRSSELQVSPQRIFGLRRPNPK